MGTLLLLLISFMCFFLMLECSWCLSFICFFLMLFHLLFSHVGVQVSTTKGTGGDVIILEEAAYCDPGFFYETVAPLLLIGRTSLLAISTLTSEINFYSRLIKMKDPNTQVTLNSRKHCVELRVVNDSMTQEPIFKTFSVELACSKCKEDGKATECKHMLHLVPSW